MSDARFVNIARLMTTYNFEIEQLQDDLKCAQCKLVLEDASQVPCGCTYCRACIDDMIARGVEFCPAGSEDCGESPLSRHQSDYSTNQKVFRLNVKCPNNGCMHECRLANIEEHLRECPRKGEECPFRELGCMQDKLAADEMGGHLQHDNRRHSEILITVIANINREIETLKRRDQVSSQEIETLKRRDQTSSQEIETLKRRDQASSEEIETLKRRDEASSQEIETLKRRDEASSQEMERLKHELVLKDGQIRLILDQVTQMQNENKSIKYDIKSIQEEKEDLAGRVRILTEKIERETAERLENDELDMARVIDHVDIEIAAVTRLIGSNKAELATEIQSVRNDSASSNKEVKSIKEDILLVKPQVESIQTPVGQDDVRFEWLIDRDVGKAVWIEIVSEYFYGAMHPYKYRLASQNFDKNGKLIIILQIDRGPNPGQDARLFKANVVITVSDRDRHEVYKSISQQCLIDSLSNHDCLSIVQFECSHLELRIAGLNLSSGVRVSCVIIPVAG